jgi:hypothetical protein
MPSAWQRAWIRLARTGRGCSLLLLARIFLGELERAGAESVALCERAREASALATLGGT